MKPAPIPLLKEEALNQLTEMESLITKYLAIYAENTGSHEFSFSHFEPVLRKGLVYYRRGRGWKVRPHWRETLAEKRQAFTRELVQGATP